MANKKKMENPVYWIIQAAIAKMGDYLSRGHWIVRKLVFLREDYAKMFTDEGEQELEDLVDMIAELTSTEKDEIRSHARNSYQAYKRSSKTSSDDVEGV